MNLSGTREQVTKYEGGGPQFIWRAYEIELTEVTVASYTYLTAMKNQFVKLRISLGAASSRPGAWRAAAGG